YCRVMHATHGEITPAYFDRQRRVPIDAIYIEPRLEPDDPQHFGYSPDDESEQDEESERPIPIIPLGTLLQRSYRTVVLGDPGAGKSTLVQRAVYDLTQERLSEAPGNKIPFVVTLRRYEEQRRTNHYSLLDHIASVVRQDLHLHAPDDAIPFLLASGRA